MQCCKFGLTFSVDVDFYFKQHVREDLVSESGRGFRGSGTLSPNTSFVLGAPNGGYNGVVFSKSRTAPSKFWTKNHETLRKIAPN